MISYIAGQAEERRFHHKARPEYGSSSNFPGCKLADERLKDTDYRYGREVDKISHAEVRGDRRDGDDLGSCSLQSANEAHKILSQSIAIACLYIGEDSRCLGVKDDDVECAALCLMRLGQFLVVVNGGSHAKSAYQA